MTGLDVGEKYKQGVSIFQQLIDEVNKVESYPFNVQIAHGFAVCKEITKERIEETIAIADSEMYQNKTELKRRA